MQRSCVDHASSDRTPSQAHSSRGTLERYFAPTSFRDSTECFIVKYIKGIPGVSRKRADALVIVLCNLKTVVLLYCGASCLYSLLAKLFWTKLEQIDNNEGKNSESIVRISIEGRAELRGSLFTPLARLSMVIY